jgi:hypothetical protein
MNYARLFSDGITIALGLVLLVISQRMATGPADSDFRPADSDLKNPQKRAKRRDSYRAVGLFLIGVVTPDSMAGLPIVREFLDSLVFVKRAG